MVKILLVEDNEMNRDMLSRRLRRRGFEVFEAVDGRQGLRMATAIIPDLILMDLSLPELDGWETTRLLRAQPETATLPIIALTAHAQNSDRRKALATGCDEFETKPIDLRRLLSKIDKLLPKATAAPEP